MLDAMNIAATGMQAQQLNVETIANNLANVNTMGFKRSRVTFVDLMARQAAQVTPTAQGDLSAGLLADAGRLGTGVGVSSALRLFDSGELKQTDSPMDLAVRGDGLLEVVLPDGSRGFCRGGTLKVRADGLLATEAGLALQSGIQVPANATGLSIGADGRVRVSVPNQAQPVDSGQLELVRFSNPGGLVPIGNGVFRATEASGEALPARPGEDGAGNLAQGYLESSNVKMVDEMVGLMLAQRAYEASAKVIQAADDMLGMVNSLRR